MSNGIQFVKNYKLTDLKPYSRNPRDNDNAVDAVVKSISEFGFINPIICDNQGNVCAGHTRIKAATEMGLTEVPVLLVDSLVGDKFVGFNIADNQTATIADWADEELGALLNELEESGFNIDSLGFDPDEFKELTECIGGNAGLTDPDDVPEPPKVAKTKLGDLYILGNHRLLCGDATKKEDVDRLMGGVKADMVFTDPPYNIDYGNIKHPKFKVRHIDNDNQTQEEYLEYSRLIANIIKGFCNGCIYVCHAPVPSGRILASALDNVCYCSTTIIWVKDVFILGRGKYQNQYEPIWFGWTDDGTNFTDKRNITNVWEVDRPKSSKLHPTMKPVELVEIAINHASKGNHVVLDLFLGSGSTLIACEKTGRKCYGMEIDPIYCDVIVKRWEEFTGKEAKLV